MKTDYALRVLFTLVEHYGQGPIPIRELARRNDVPKRFLEHIMLDLKSKGWVKIEAGQSGQIIFYGDTADQWWNIAANFGVVSYGMNVDDDITKTTASSISGPDGTWQHLTIVRDVGNDKLRIYVNGVEEDNITDNTGSINNATYHKTYIGRKTASGVGSEYVTGLIDDVRIYNYARTPAQIAWDYNRGKPVGHWKFDEGEGGTIYDQSGNANNGTIQLGVSGVTATGTVASSSDSFWYNGRDGKVNGAGSFDGADDYVNIGNTNATTSAVSFWIYPDATTDDVIDFDGGTHTITIASNVVTAGGFSAPAIYVDGVRKSTISTGAWHHVFVKTDTGFDVNNMTIGKIGAGFFDGKLDEVKIYNYALTAEQILTEYNGGAVRFGD